MMRMLMRMMRMMRMLMRMMRMLRRMLMMRMLMRMMRMMRSPHASCGSEVAWVGCHPRKVACVAWVWLERPYEVKVRVKLTW